MVTPDPHNHTIQMCDLPKIIKFPVYVLTEFKLAVMILSIETGTVMAHYGTLAESLALGQSFFILESKSSEISLATELSQELNLGEEVLHVLCVGHYGVV